MWFKGGSTCTELWHPRDSRAWRWWRKHQLEFTFQHGYWCSLGRPASLSETAGGNGIWLLSFPSFPSLACSSDAWAQQHNCDKRIQQFSRTAKYPAKNHKNAYSQGQVGTLGMIRTILTRTAPSCQGLSQAKPNTECVSKRFLPKDTKQNSTKELPLLS